MFDAIKQNRLRWLGHVLQKDDDDDWVKKIMFDGKGHGYDGARWRTNQATPA